MSSVSCLSPPSSGARVASRADLFALLERIDLQCTEYFKAQHGALDRRQRKIVRAALQSMRDRLHSNIRANIVIEDEIPDSEKEIEPVNSELEQRVSTLMSEAEALQVQLQASRKMGLALFEEAVSLQASSSDATDLVSDAVTSLEQRDVRALPENPESLGRLLRKTNSSLGSVSSILPQCLVTMDDLIHVVETKLHVPPSELQKVLDENVSPGQEAFNPPPRKRQKLLYPLFSKRF